jgi:hypothetical protein
VFLQLLIPCTLFLTSSLQQRYFVLSESTTCFCVLRIFSKAVVTAYGLVPVGLRSSVPIRSVEAVETVPTVAAKGKRFAASG